MGWGGGVSGGGGGCIDPGCENQIRLGVSGGVGVA